MLISVEFVLLFIAGLLFIIGKVASFLVMARVYEHSNEVIDGIYVGDWKSVHELKNIVKAVVNARRQSDDDIQSLDMLHIPIDDTESSNISAYFEASNAFIDRHVRRNEKVLVHCFAGMSRSVTLLAAYIMWKHHVNDHEALRIIKERRSIIKPNPGFLRQLREYNSRIKT
jgi:protein-tyrosine phosphatase